MSSEDYNKLAGIEENADVNIIEAITVNGDAVSVTDKTAVIEVNETHGVLLDTIPTDTTLTYQEDNKTKSFTIGMSAIYPDDSSGDGYGMHFFKGTTSEGNAIWGKAVSDEKYALKSYTYTKDESDELFAKKSETVKLLPLSVFELITKYTENGIMTEEDYNTLMSYAPNETNEYMINYPGSGICVFNIQNDLSSVYVLIRFSLEEEDTLWLWTINKDTRSVTNSYSTKHVGSRTEGEISIFAGSQDGDGTVSSGSIILKRNGLGNKFLSDNGSYIGIDVHPDGVRLETEPTDDTLTYMVGDVTYNFELGMSAIYPDAGSDDGYGISFFKGTTSEGKAVWEKGGQTYEHPKFTAHEKGLYKISVTKEGHVDSAEPVVKEDITALGIPDSIKYYTAGKGISMEGDMFVHANNVNPDNIGPLSVSMNNGVNIPSISYDSYGHIIGGDTITCYMDLASSSVNGLMSINDKIKMDYLDSYTTATTVTNLNVNFQSIYVTLSNNATLSANYTGSSLNGRTITAFVYTPSSVTITIPTTGDYVSMCGSSYTTKAEGWVEFSLVCVNGVWHIAKLEAE